ncbi:hypothetical protein [Yersinia sp. 2466 StPb PI]|uniref:hypothetical protein n=1 Tax=Yersinia sp. 2466 StPb PI TaxID=3061648 RepID=UPI00355C0260
MSDVNFNGVYIANDMIYKCFDDILQGSDDCDFVCGVKRELNDIFESFKIKYDFNQKSKFNEFEINLGKSDNEIDLVTLINNYMGSENKLTSRVNGIHYNFIKSINLNFNQSTLSKKYELTLNHNGRYDLIKKESPTSVVKSAGYNDFISYLNISVGTPSEQVINVKSLKNENVGFEYCQGDEIVDICSANFPKWKDVIITHGRGGLSNSEWNENYNSIKSENSGKGCKFWNEYYTLTITNTTLPQALENDLIYLKNRIIPSISDMIKVVMDKAYPPSKGLWGRLIYFIVAHLFPSLSKEVNEKMIKSKSELEDFYLLLLGAKKEVQDAEQNIDKAPCIYHLALQLLKQCIPAQYPFDPLNILSPDRKVWLALQKEWLEPLKPPNQNPLNS